MTRSAGKRRPLIERLFPEHRVYVKTGENKTRYFKLTSRTQAIAAGGMVFGLGWTLLSTSALIIGMITADSESNQAQVIHDAYEARIAELIAERDQRAREAAAVQERFQLALAEISSFQSNSLAFDMHQKELDNSIRLLRNKLALAIKARDDAATAASEARIELASMTNSMRDKIDTADEIAATLDTINTAFSDTVEQRDTSGARLAELEENLAALEFRARVDADKQERIFTQLEEAVEVALSPLEKMLSTTGKDVDQLVSRIKDQYSGSGGPYVPASLPTWAEDDDTYRRFHSLMIDIDRVHLMQIAASQLPFAAPVKGTVRYTSGFGTRRDPINGRSRAHNGQDLAGRPGTPILATGDGTVTFAGRQSGYGNVVRISHAFGYETLYAHLRNIDVNVGESVSRGDVIGGMGNTGRSTGTHLHYEIRIGGKPTNPMPYMKAARNVF